MLGHVRFGDIDGTPRRRAGRSEMTVCTVHLNNVAAKKKDVAKHVLVEMMADCLCNRCLVIGGDFNQAAYGSPSLAEQSFQEAVRKLRLVVDYELFVEGCLLVSVISYGPDLELNVRMAKKFVNMENRDLHLFGSDQDWHRPLLVHLRSVASGTARQRSDEGAFRRQQQKRAKFDATIQAGNARSAPSSSERSSMPW
jgi:hypothetical protein